jgi:hypothetical protein
MSVKVTQNFYFIKKTTTFFTVDQNFPEFQVSGGGFQRLHHEILPTSFYNMSAENSTRSVPTKFRVVNILVDFQQLISLVAG